MDYLPPDRPIKSVPYPRASILTEDQLFSSSSGLPSIPLLREHLLAEGRLDEKCALRLIDLAQQIFEREPNMLFIERPITIVADIHGQFYDLLTILAAGGDPAETRYLFLGDYVDRGLFECECVFLLFALKVTYPQNFNLLRGNHETRQMAKAFQFKMECERKYRSRSLYKACMRAFDTLPVCALVDSRFLCMHGGLSPNIRILSDIEKLDRFVETPDSGPLCDLLWSDPSENFDDIDDQQPEFKPNNVRGCAHFFSYYACRDFLLRNNLVSIIRGHEVQKNGVRFFRKSSRTKFPVLISLFSAPNYCDTYNNIAAILKIDDHQQLSVVNIEAHAHPFVLPNFENGFQFGERFVLYHVTNLLLSIFNMYSPEELAAEDGRHDKTGVELLNKKRLIGTMDRAYAELKKINKITLNLRGLTPSYSAYKELLTRPEIKALVNEAEKGRITSFDQAIQLDHIFERRPHT
ncbi:unnamed protein product [Rotaria sp. Silwood1]|nr:unnamed protein product [Rotaria sp. Silwood1]CAF3538596.1 unnamed protein product [Rotaria sp. Silwood1]CAF4849100.1 unnamed protein product [Rotaria sp. Silwood1]CAF4935928.1 unnamed protein product [Rotaria sp. Silwood1]